MRRTICLVKHRDACEVHRVCPKMYNDGSMGNLKPSGNAFVNDSPLEVDADDIFPEMKDDEVYIYKLIKVIKKTDLKKAKV